MLRPFFMPDHATGTVIAGRLAFPPLKTPYATVKKRADMTDKRIPTDQPIDLNALARLSEALVAAGLRAGATEADAVAARGDAVSVTIRSGALQEAERADGVEIGLRVLIGGRQAIVSASETSTHTIEEMAERAVAMAREAPIDDMLGLADPDQLARDFDTAPLELFDPADGPDPAGLEQKSLEAEAAALGVQGIRQVEAASASFSRSGSWRHASNGFSAGSHRSMHGLSVVAITGEGNAMERDWAGEGRVFLEDMPSPESIGLLGAQRTLDRTGAVPAPTGAVPVLFDERISASLVGHILGAINGNAVTRGASWLRDAMGEAVLPAGMDLVEDPHRPRYGASRLFDAEGLPTQKRKLIDNGNLAGWVLDLASARKLGLAPTGNASRGAGGPVGASTSNVILTQGTATRDELIAQMGRGLLVTSFLGATINPTTGDYSRGISGFWIENGKISHAVNECTIAGNLREFLPRMIAANDANPFRGAQVPSLLVEGLTVAGA